MVRHASAQQTGLCDVHAGLIFQQHVVGLCLVQRVTVLLKGHVFNRTAQRVDPEIREIGLDGEQFAAVCWCHSRSGRRIGYA